MLYAVQSLELFEKKVSEVTQKEVKKTPLVVPLVLGFEGHSVRYVVQNGEPWLVARDLAAPLDITVRRVRQFVAELSKEDYGEVKVQASTGSLGADIVLRLVSPSGAYQLILQSRKPVGRRLRKWLADLGVAHDRGQLVRTGQQCSVQTDPSLAALERRVAELEKRFNPSSRGKQALCTPITIEIAEPLTHFLSECCLIGPVNAFRTQAASLYEAFKRWCELSRPAERDWTQAAFGRGLAAQGYSRHRTNGYFLWCGIALQAALPAPGR